ncbi:uncharacterized protein [Gossypium hirsutum]|uniref:Uncharacterized protein n=1 Tax=Gossypium hirsutum TaxID=3635 RepID=A0A1U8HW57_GOSHI|nr:uncharacterized protein LOC107887864 [Gossypium hirsutum]
MPSYVKFMKHIKSKKHRLREFKTIPLTERCTAMLMNKLPPKLKDIGSFTIPFSIGNHYVGKALCDLGASINLMPMLIFKKLGIGKVRPTIVTFHLADGSYTHPEHKIEDVLVRVDKFIFLTNFHIFECEVDHDLPIILRRPFLAICRTLIDVQNGKLTMRVNDQKVTFNVFNALKCTDENKECHIIDLIEAEMDEFAKFCYDNFDSEDNLMEQGDIASFEELGEFMEARQIMYRLGKKFEILDLLEQSFKPPKPFVKESPIPELKPLPQHLKYAYLGNNSIFPIIISTELTLDQEDRLLEVLRRSKRALG